MTTETERGGWGCQEYHYTITKLNTHTHTSYIHELTNEDKGRTMFACSTTHTVTDKSICLEKKPIFFLKL